MSFNMSVLLSRTADVALAPAGPTTSVIAPNLTLIVTMAVTVACGVYLCLERSLVRVLLGVLLLSNGLGLLYLVVSGPGGTPAFVGEDETTMSDPLPQAMWLTAIVISLATIGFLLALSYRLWQSGGSDDVPDDIEDARIKNLAHLDVASDTLESGVGSTTESDESAGPDTIDARGTLGAPDEPDPHEVPDPAQPPASPRARHRAERAHEHSETPEERLAPERESQEGHA